MDSFLFQSAIYLAAACIAVPLCVRFGLGSVLGYLLAGIVIGPVAGLIGSEAESLRHIAEFGVVMMLFIIGLELDPQTLWNMRHKLIGLGGLQVSLTTLVVALAAYYLGQPASISIVIGLIFALSSTAIVLQTLNEKDLMRTGGGRSSFSVLLMQDIAVIPMLVLIPLLALPNSIRSVEVVDGHDALPTSEGVETAVAVMSFIETLPGWGVMLVTLGAITAVVLGGYFLTGPVFRYISLSKLRDMYTAVALLFVVGVAALMLLVGLSPALGTFLAGVVLANSEFRHELESNIEPFKGLLLGLFFITVGAGINFETLFGAPLTILAITAGVMVIKAVILFVLATIFKLKGRDKILFTLSLAQAGEFGFVLISFSIQQNVLPIGLSETLLLVVALSMLLTPLLFISFEELSRRLAPANPDQAADHIDEQNEVIIAGIGRFGQVVNRMAQTAGLNTTVLDHDLATIQLMRKFGFKGFLGDPTRHDLLHSAGLDTAKVLVVALDDPKAASLLVKYARKVRPDIHIVASARDRIHVYQLYRAGADDIVRELFDSSLRAGRYVLENMGLTEFEAHEHEETFYKHDRHALQELAILWEPEMPISKQTAYIERAKELHNDLETELVEVLDEGDDATEPKPAKSKSAAPKPTVSKTATPKRKNKKS